MKKMHLLYRITSILLLVISYVIYNSQLYIHYDVLLDYFIPIGIIVISVYELILIQDRRLNLSKVLQFLMLSTLLFSSLYHIQTHLIKTGNSTLLIGEFIIMALILIFDNEEYKKMNTKGLIPFCVAVTLALTFDFWISSQIAANPLSDAVVNMAINAEGIIFLVLFAFLLYRGVKYKGVRYIVERGFISAILLSAVVMSYFPISNDRVGTENLLIFMKWFAYMLIIDLVISNLKEDMWLANESYMMDYFEAFKKNVNAFMLIQKKDNVRYIIKNLNDKAQRLLQLKKDGIENFTLDDFFNLNIEFVRYLNEAGTYLLLDQKVRRRDKAEFYADIQIQTITKHEIIFSIVDVRDITKRKEILKKIAIRESVFSNAVEAIMIVDDHDLIVDINPSFEKIYGYSRFECIGSRPSIIKSGVLDRKFYDRMQYEVQNKGYYQGEFINKTKIGELVTLNQSISRLYLEDTNEIYYVSIASDISEKKKSEALIFDLAFRDNVNKIFNRTYLLQHEAYYPYQVASLVTITDYKLLMGYFDKEFLDLFMSTIVRKLEMSVDEGNLFKWSENQILVLIQVDEAAQSDYEKESIEAIYQALTQNVIIQNQQIHPEITVTWIRSKLSHQDMRKDLHYLDATLAYAIKQNVKVLEYTQTLEGEFERAKQIEILLKDAILNNELFVLYQPIVDIQDNVIKGFEALVRWQSPILGIVHPLEFIGVAEGNQSILNVGFFVANKALKLLADIQEAMPDVFMAINVSVIQLMDQHFFEQINNLVKRYGISPPQISIEITESQDLYNLFSVSNNLSKFREAGYLLSIDDFGTGFSTLSRINNINPDYVKIDKVFFDDIETSIRSTLLTNGIIAFTEQIGLNVIAEGIETIEQLIYLKNQNVRYIQGFIFSYPISDVQVKNLIESPMEIERFFSEEFNEDLKLLQKFDDSIVNDHMKLKDLSFIEFDDTLKILSCSRSFMELVGYDFEKILNQPITKFFILKEREEWEDLFTRTTRAFVSHVETSLGKEISVMVNSRVEFDKKQDKLKVYCILKDLSDQANVIQQFLLEQESFIKFFEYSPLPSIVWEEDFKIVVANERAYHLFRNPEKITENPNLKNVLNKDTFKDFSYYYNRLFAGYAQEFMITIVDDNGILRETLWHNAPLFDDNGGVKQVLTIIQDLTELNRQTEISRILSNAADLSDRLIIYTNDVYEILFANQKTIEMFGLSEYGYNVYSIKELDIKLIDQRSESINIESLGYESWSGVAQVKDINGNIRIYDAVRDGSYYSDPKLIKGYMFTFKDKHDDFKDHQEIEQLRRALQEQDRLVSVGKLIAGIAHEINNPLSYLLSNTQFLLETEAPLEKVLGSDSDLLEDLKDVFNSYNEGLNVIKTIVSDLKSYSRKADETEKTNCDINVLISQTLRIAHNEIKYTSVARLDLDEQLPLIKGNDSKLQQVFLNLIINANHAIVARYQNEMGEITIKTKQAPDEVICTIEDNGIGMTEEVKAHIFEAFYTTKEKGIGTGLGLSVSKEIIEEFHEGKLSVESTVNVGTKFIITLPIAERDSKENLVD
ncbi:EAL domain-containing protein [Fusibacter sp. 3D3]|uniref:EAL domain-containing protein n=1 Tax=Fusibacter sp. 3D3 TaxID=1048380 RepID=UPI000853EC44|nr:EAL domain-containing protein [Fusibacter sp. 3D3]GAU79984.1 diguanylate cyclase/phosphodiesterase (GGDEF & EAL domains) with PAS/PAC sensor(s) [Fusibacter sp. 3D3]